MEELLENKRLMSLLTSSIRYSLRDMEAKLTTVAKEDYYHEDFQSTYNGYKIIYNKLTGKEWEEPTKASTC